MYERGLGKFFEFSRCVLQFISDGGRERKEGGTAENKVGGAGDRGPGYSQPDWDTICRKQW